MDFRLAPDVNTVSISFSLNSFQSLGPRIDTHGNFMIFLVFLVLIWPLLFGFVMFRKYSVAMLVSLCLSCPFSVKMVIRISISFWRYFSVHILYARERKSLNAPIVVCGAIFDFGFICIFVINIFQKFVKSYEL